MGTSTTTGAIFFDEKGEEVFRHVGFMSEKEIVKQLNSMGVK